MGELLEKYMEMSDQKQQSAPREKAMEVTPSNASKPIAVSEDSGSIEKSNSRGIKRTRRVFVCDKPCVRF